MTIETINNTDAILAAYVIGKDRELLGDYLLNYAGMKEVRDRADFISVLINEGIEGLSQSEQQKLYRWSTMMSENLANPDRLERRNFFKNIGKRAILLYAGAAGFEGFQGKYARAAGLGGFGAVGGGLVMRAERMAQESEIVFKDKLTQWLKEKYDIDFVLPPTQGQSASR